MLWLCIYLPQLSLEALAPSKEIPTAVSVNQRNKRRIIACNAAAVKVGLSPATELTTALALYPQLRTLERNAKAERMALKRLAAWAYQWSSRVTWQEALADDIGDYAATLWLEIGASRTLFGGYALLIKQLESSLRLLEYTYRLGIAPTVEGAAVLARAGKRVLVTAQKHLQVILHTLPVTYLALPSAITYALKRSGIVDIGTLLDLPSDAVARRFGPDATLYLARLCGSAPDPRPAYRLPKHYRERCEFGFAVNSVAALLFPLQRMLQEFCGYLRAADIATQRYTIIFEHEQQAVTRVIIGLATPSRDVERLFSLAREQLHNLTLTANVYGLRIEATEFTPPTVRQHNLFYSEAEATDELQQVLEKIAARLGQNAVRTLQATADHRPEDAGRFSTSFSTRAPMPPACPRPLWLLTEPHRLHTPPNINAQPERIDGGWWAVPMQRDYYIINSCTGEHCWVFFNRNDHQWYLHGYWA